MTSPRGVDVALDDVAIEPAIGSHGTLQVDPVPLRNRTQVGPAQGLGDDVRATPIRPDLDGGQANTVDGKESPTLSRSRVRKKSQAPAAGTCDAFHCAQ